MVMWEKALVVCMAVLVVALPAITQVSVAQTIPAQKQEVQIVLPQGQGLSDAQLKKTDGEGAITAVIGAVCGGAYEYGQERMKGEKINLGSIALSAAYGAATSSLVPDALVIKVAASSVRWTARAVAAGGTAAASVGVRIGNAFKSAGLAVYNAFKSFGSFFRRK